jgi:hypothetical protein
MARFTDLVLAALISGGVVSTVVGFLLTRRTMELKSAIENQFKEQFEIARSQRSYKERALAELFGPLFMSFERTRRAFERWKPGSLFLEANVVRTANLQIRDLLLAKGHLIPPELLDDASRLIEHYDKWLEVYEREREGPNASKEDYVFVGPEGFPFPQDAEQRFKDHCRRLLRDLYGAGT